MAESRSFSRAGVALALVVQMGCSDDGPNWNLPGSDGGLDGGGSSIPSSSSPSDDERPDASMGTSDSDGLTVTLDSGSGATSTSFEADASVSSSAETSGEQTSSTPEADASMSTEGETSVTETSAATDTSSTPETTGGTSSTPEMTTDVTSEPTPACDGGSCESMTDAATPSVTVCGYQIDESQGIALSDVLPGYLAGQDGGVADGGVESTCYPPCIAALLEACPVVSECTVNALGSEACWTNGTGQLQEIEDGESALIITESAYSAGVPCISGTQTLSYETFASTYVWRDGVGEIVATGTDESGGLEVTCSDSELAVPVDREQCSPELGQVLYTQLSCDLQ